MRASTFFHNRSFHRHDPKPNRWPDVLSDKGHASWFCQRCYATGPLVRCPSPEQADAMQAEHDAHYAQCKGNKDGRG